MKRAVFLLLFASIAAAVEPNYVKTTVYKVGKDGANDKDLITTDYSDGLGRSIQSKVKIDDTKDRVSCTFYDDAGRPNVTTKAFIDYAKPGTYLSGVLGDVGVFGQLKASQNNDIRAYS